MNKQQLLKTSGTDALSFRKKLRKTLLGVANLVPRALVPGFGGGGQETRPGDEVGGWHPPPISPSPPPSLPSLYVQGVNGFDFYFDLF